MSGSDGREYRGVLDGYVAVTRCGRARSASNHPHMNLVVKNAEEVTKAGTPEEKIVKREMIIIRGDNIVYISP